MSEWSCNNQCGSNCCSELFVTTDADQRREFEGNNSITFRHQLSHYFTWLGYHKGVRIEKHDNLKIVHFPDVEYKFIYNPFLKSDVLWMPLVCDKLIGKKCKIYRARPKICKESKCVVFSREPEIRWYGLNGVIKR